MKKIVAGVSILMIASCGPRPPIHQQSIQRPAPGTTGEKTEYEQHIQKLAFGTPREQIEIAQRALESAGTAAYPMLIGHLKDSTPAADCLRVQDVLWDLGHPSIGHVCFGIIQGQIEGHWPKGYRQYYVLTPENIKRWLDAHQGLSLRELRIVAAQESLRRAESEMRQRTAADYQKGVLEFLRDNLQKANE
jgi:hypothetical protein